ncbi:ABC transporter permease [Algoriphagus sp. oki45]|uniref:ABC transporter permease n=1 Tax=Algoriphagus sp. oki45 TaxID=3067294 RepID=UPI0027F88A84|nr:ABC transporter permease [Algoriphagus sp. oki45]
MVSHLLKTSLRSFRSNPFYNGISLAGISLGIATCLLMLSYWSKETHFDQFHSDFEQVYRIAQSKEIEGGGEVLSASTFSNLGRHLFDQSSLIESAVRIHRNSSNTSLQAGEEILIQEDIVGVENTFFDLFDFEFLYGSVSTWKSTPQAVILTQEVSERLFGEQNPVGQPLLVNGSYGVYGSEGYEEFRNYTVAGVLKSIPDDTHLKFSVLISLDLYAEPDREFANWGDQFFTYVKLRNGKSEADLNQALAQISSDHFPNTGLSFFTQPLTSIHLRSHLLNEFKANGDPGSIWIMVGLAFLVLVLACTNYINFTLARSIQRQKELSLRRIFWASKGQLFRQLVLEAALINMLALGLAALIIVLVNPLLQSITGLDLLSPFFLFENILLALLIWVLAVLISGFYPAWSIACRNYKKLIPEGFQAPQFQKPLVILQFTVSIFVVAFTLLIYQQIRFMQEKDLGFELNQTLVLTGPTVIIDQENWDQRLSTFLEEIRKMPEVHSVSSSNFVPGQPIRGKAEGYVRQLNQSEEGAQTYYFSQVDSRFLKEFKMRLLAGELFSPEKPQEKGLVISRQASRFLGFESPKDAIGQKIHYRINSTPEIIGVVEDFHLLGAQEEFQPVIFELRELPDSYFFVHFQEGLDRAVVEKTEQLWASFFPSNPIQFFFLDDFFNRQYEQENNFFTAMKLFTGLTLLISFFGFYGLLFWVANSRTKELAIRKTLGAELKDFLNLLGKEAVIFLLVAGLVSGPFVAWLGTFWLESYAFRISPNLWVFVLPILGFGMLIGVLVWIQALKINFQNPINNLRDE